MLYFLLDPEEDLWAWHGEGNRGWSRLQNEGFYRLFSSPNTIRVITTRGIRWAGHVARLVTGDVHKGFWLGDLREGDNLKDLGLDGRILFKWIFEKWDEEPGL